MTTTATDRSAVTGMLNEHVATATDLFSQLKQAHWRVEGPNFIALHELFDRQADLIRGYVDEFAERIKALGGDAHGTVRAAAAASRLPEFPDVRDERSVVRALCERFETFSKMLSEAIERSEQAGDMTTQDIFIEVQREVDRHAWFLRAHLD
jgi:starvation-inducible DNA-binding protein